MSLEWDCKCNLLTLVTVHFVQAQTQSKSKIQSNNVDKGVVNKRTKDYDYDYINFYYKQVHCSSLLNISSIISI